MIKDIVIDTKDFDRFLEEKQRSVQSLYDTAFRAFAERVVAAAKAIAPVDTGKLRDSIKFEVANDGVWIISGAEYSEFVEYGTKKSSAQPYFDVSIEENTAFLYAEIERELTK